MNYVIAMKLALEALERYAPQHGNPDDMSEAITALRTAIEQAEKQEPVAWAEQIITDLHACYDSEMIKELDSGDELIRLDAAIACVEEAAERHTAPPAAQWVGLTDEEKEQATGWSVEHIEQALKEKNSGNQDGCSHAALPAADDLIATYEKGFKDGAAQRQPLSQYAIDRIIGRLQVEMPEWLDNDVMTQFARAVEAAHGITGEKT